MEIKVIGSGGCVSIPRPLCQCRICKEARIKGVPYARCGHYPLRRRLGKVL